MIHPPADPEPIDIIARRLHGQARWRADGWPAWEDLNPGEAFEAELIQAAYDQAREFVAMYIRSEE